MAMVFAPYAPPGTDISRVIRLCLVHDMPEIYAGDTPFHDQAGREQAAQREWHAAMRLFGLLPLEEQATLKAFWNEFELGQTPEALFARALDRIQPLLQFFFSSSYHWKELKITRATAEERNLPIIMKGAPALWNMLILPLFDVAEAQSVFADPTD